MLNFHEAHKTLDEFGRHIRALPKRSPERAIKEREIKFFRTRLLLTQFPPRKPSAIPLIHISEVTK